MNPVAAISAAMAIAPMPQTGILTCMTQTERQYCLFMNGHKYHRNAGCKRHDNAYGINGGGSGGDRLLADLGLFNHMRAQGDPLALVVWAFTRCFGWFFFNYHGQPWHGQLIRKLCPRY